MTWGTLPYRLDGSAEGRFNEQHILFCVAEKKIASAVGPKPDGIDVAGHGIDFANAVAGGNASERLFGVVLLPE